MGGWRIGVPRRKWGFALCFVLALGIVAAGAANGRTVPAVALVSLTLNLIIWLERRVRAEQVAAPSQADMELLGKARQLRLLVDSIPGMVTVNNPQGKIEYANQQVLDFLGKSFDELPNGGYFRLMHDDDRAAVLDTWWTCVRTHQPLAVSYRLRRHDGEFRWVEMQVVPRLSHGKVVNWYGLISDVDERRRVEQALRDSERQLRLIIETIPALVWRATPDGNTDYLNQRVVDYVGKTLPEMSQPLWTSIIHPDDMANTGRRWNQARAERRPYVDTLRLLGADGSYRWSQVRGEPLCNEAGEIVHWYGVNFDIHDSKMTEEALSLAHARLLRASQAAARAELSASIAHEINQPLAAVVGHAQACLRWLAPDALNLERARLTATRVIRDANATADVVDRVRALFKQAMPSMIELDLNQVAREAYELISGEADDVHIELELSNAMPRVLGDRIQLQQVLVNLIRNGIEAMADISDRPRELHVRSRTEVQDACSIVIDVRDQGNGIRDPRAVFDPFYTTKNRGMGMGLAVCRSIIVAHGGRIWATQNETFGATFTFALPTRRVDDAV